MSNIRPIFSIISVVYNDVLGIEKTIFSVINQNFKNYEFIVIDGLSSDGTSAKIVEYSKFINKYICEKDEGISDALNKGLSFAKGEWVYFLNSGDYFIDNETLSKVYSDLLIKSTFQIVSGRVKIVDFMGNYMGYCHPNKVFHINELYKRNIIAHQATFVRLELFQKIGFFKNYKIQMDYDFWIRSMKNNISFNLTNFIVANFSRNGVSSERSNYKAAIREKLHVLLVHNIISKSKYWFLLYKESLLFDIKTILRGVIGPEKSKLLSLYRLKKS